MTYLRENQKLGPIQRSQQVGWLSRTWARSTAIRGLRKIAKRALKSSGVKHGAVFYAIGCSPQIAGGTIILIMPHHLPH